MEDWAAWFKQTKGDLEWLFLERSFDREASLILDRVILALEGTST